MRKLMVAQDGAVLANVRVHGLHYGHANIDGVPSAYQFVVDCVFHEVCWFILPEVHVYIADASVHGIVLCGVVEIVPTSDVVSLGRGNEIRILKELKVLLDGHVVGGNPGDGLDGVGELCRVHKSADIAHDNIEEVFKQGCVPYLVSFLDILKVDGFAQAGEILFFERFGRLEDAFRKTSEHEIFTKHGMVVSRFCF